MAHPEKKLWHKPAFRELSPEDVQAIYDDATEAERSKLDELFEHLCVARERLSKARKSAAGGRCAATNHLVSQWEKLARDQFRQ